MNYMDKTLKDFTAAELADLKSKNSWYYGELHDAEIALKFSGAEIVDSNDNNKIIGLRTRSLKKIVEALASPNFLYTRKKDYGYAIYHRDPESPTGVFNKCGFDEEFSFLIRAITNNGALSPTEKR